MGVNLHMMDFRGLLGAHRGLKPAPKPPKSLILHFLPKISGTLGPFYPLKAALQTPALAYHIDVTRPSYSPLFPLLSILPRNSPFSLTLALNFPL